MAKLNCVTVLAPAKLNLALDVVGLLPNGYHNLGCNRCYLVNLEFVETYQGSDIMVNGDTIQVSRSRRKPFLDALNEYMNEVGK